MSFKERLTKMNETWDTSRQEKGGGFNDAFEDGVQTFQLQSLGLKESNSSGELMAVCEHYCLEGANAGDVYTQFFNLEKQNDEGKIWGQIFLAQLLETVGYETPADMGDMEEVLASVAEDAPKYTARIKTSKEGFKNLNIIRVLEQKAAFEGDRGEGGAAAPAQTPKATGKPAVNGKRPALAVAPEPEPEAEAPVEAAADDQADLVPFCEAWDVTRGETRDATLATIREFEWKEADLTPEELAVLKANGITYKAKPAVMQPGSGRTVTKAPVPAKPAVKAPVKPAPKAPVGAARRK